MALFYIIIAAIRDLSLSLSIKLHILKMILGHSPIKHYYYFSIWTWRLLHQQLLLSRPQFHLCPSELSHHLDTLQGFARLPTDDLPFTVRNLLAYLSDVRWNKLRRRVGYLPFPKLESSGCDVSLHVRRHCPRRNHARHHMHWRLFAFACRNYDVLA